ncbi:MAG: replication protein [Armatimonadetes bacterium]|nr:replication protein [Armatimonadota bacterium]
MMSKEVSPIQGTTPVSNLLLDKIMPRLRDTEIRILLVVSRQTVGWLQADGTRKKADWLSHFQLKRKTGRSSAAISKAIDVLVRAKLIVVRDSFGVPLMSARARRQSHSRLCFSLNADFGRIRIYRKASHARKQISKRRNDKTKLYKDKQQHGKRREHSSGQAFGEVVKREQP